MASKRFGKVVKLGRSLAVVLPKDWTRGNDVQPGDAVKIEYDGVVSVTALDKGMVESDG